MSFIMTLADLKAMALLCFLFSRIESSLLTNSNSNEFKRRGKTHLKVDSEKVLPKHTLLPPKKAM